METAAAFLAVRPRSVAETRRRLRYLGYRQELVERVVERLVEVGYLDDQAFARAWLESRDRARPRGAAALRRELALKGVDRAVIDELLAEREAASSETAAVDGSAASSGSTAEEGAAATSAWGAARGADADAARRLLERKRAQLDREPDPRKRRQKAYALLARNGFDPEICREAAATLAASADAPDEAAAEP
jgi:regulatory protein